MVGWNCWEVVQGEHLCCLSEEPVDFHWPPDWDGVVAEGVWMWHLCLFI